MMWWCAMKYSQQFNYRRRKRYLRLVWSLAVLLLAVIIASLIYLYYQATKDDQNNKATSGQTTKYLAPSVRVFDTSYFHFQTNNTWAEIPAETTPNKFVYRSIRAGLVEHELVIYVDQLPNNLFANRVLPVSQDGNHKLSPITVSEHCIKAAGGSQAMPMEVVVEQVKMLCKSDTTNYTVLLGLVNGSTAMSLARPDGSKKNYTIAYADLRSIYDPTELIQIIDSFQTR